MKNLFLTIFWCLAIAVSPVLAGSSSPEKADSADSRELQEVENPVSRAISAEQVQNLPQKRYFPRAGDIGIGFDGTPFLNYAGNMFNGTTDNSLDLGDYTLHFRYFLTDDAAVRLSFNIFSDKEVDMFYVDDQADQTVDPLSRAQVEDRRVTYTNQFEMKAGYLMFRGQNRLRGFFGGDVFFGYGKQRFEYDYGNEMTVINASPLTVSNWNSGAAASLSSRTLESTSGSIINVGVGAVVGAEYYFMPKVSVGAEMGLVYGYTFYGQGNESAETMVGLNHVEEDVALSPGYSERAAFTTFPYTFGNLYLMVHF